MLVELSAIIGLTGLLAIAVALVVFARLSQRLGSVTHVRPYFVGLYIAASLILIGVVSRLIYLINALSISVAPPQDWLYIVLCDGLPALGITIALPIIWFYWSWLLAERD